jgi:arylsulfatase A-like enzyme
MRNFACELSAVDDGVGRVMGTLDRLNLNDDTLVIFCADQGWLGGQHGIWGMGDHTRPLGAFDGMMQVPLVFRHVGKIKTARTTDLMVSNYDFMPSVLDYLGVAAPESKPDSPGRSYAPTLRDEKQPWDNVVYYEMENVRAIRSADWKYVRRYPSGPDELYDFAHDPEERKNLADAAEQQSAKTQLAKRLDAFFDRYADPKYDLYRGGASKSKLLSQPGLAPLTRIDARGTP